jgi:hypothetical protein
MTKKERKAYADGLKRGAQIALEAEEKLKSVSRTQAIGAGFAADAIIDVIDLMELGVF